jgi:hypothetical protein
VQYRDRVHSLSPPDKNKKAALSGAGENGPKNGNIPHGTPFPYAGMIQFRFQGFFLRLLEEPPPTIKHLLHS